MRFFRQYQSWFRVSLVLCVIGLLGSEFAHANANGTSKDAQHHGEVAVNEDLHESREFELDSLDLVLADRIFYNDWISLWVEISPVVPATASPPIGRLDLAAICRFLL